jgi:uncharacterized membrane protein (DUF4010 family)
MPSLTPAAAAGAALSSLSTALQLILILYLANPVLANQLLPALIVVTLVAIFYGGWLARDAVQVQVSHEFPWRAVEFKRSFGFALLVTAVMFISALLEDRYGALGASVGIALAGFADVHAAAASAATLADYGSLPMNAAILGIILAVTTNTLSKAIVAFVSGGRRFGVRVVAGLLLMLLALWAMVVLTVFY